MVVGLEFEAGGLLSEQLPVCLIFAPASRILHSFIKVYVFGECIQYPQTGLNSSVQENTFAEKNNPAKEKLNRKILMPVFIVIEIVNNVLNTIANNDGRINFTNFHWS